MSKPTREKRLRLDLGPQEEDARGYTEAAAPEDWEEFGAGLDPNNPFGDSDENTDEELLAITEKIELTVTSPSPAESTTQETGTTRSSSHDGSFSRGENSPPDDSRPKSAPLVMNMGMMPSVLLKRKKKREAEAREKGDSETPDDIYIPKALSLDGPPQQDQNRRRKEEAKRKKEEKTNQKKKEDRDKAKIILLSEPEIVRHCFFDNDKVFNEKYGEKSLEERENYLDVVMSGGATSDNIIRLVFSEKATLDMIRKAMKGRQGNQEFVYQIRDKVAGKNYGFTVSVFDPFRSGEDQLVMKYYAKDFMDTKTSEKRKSSEFFIYKLLELLGFGPKVYFSCYEGKSPTIITEDLSVKKRTVGGVKTKVFRTYGQIRGDLYGDSVEPGSLKYEICQPSDEGDNPEYHRFCRDVIALEVAASILQVSDITDNYGNVGVVETSFPDARPVKQKPKLVDFSTRRTAVEAGRAAILPTYDDIISTMEKEQCVLPFAKDARHASFDDYADAIRSLIEGRTLTSGKKRPSMREAITESLKAAEEVRNVMLSFDRKAAEAFSVDSDLSDSCSASSSEEDLSKLAKKGSSSKKQSLVPEISSVNRGLKAYAEELERMLSNLENLLSGQLSQRSNPPASVSPEPTKKPLKGQQPGRNSTSSWL